MSSRAVSARGELFRAMIRPNQSMSARQLAIFVIIFALLSLTIALSFLSLGFWLILPFAGLEIVIVAVAVGASLKRSRDFELIVIDEEQVHVTQRRNGRTARHVFQRYWTRLRIEVATPMHRSQLWLGSHGCFVCVGEDATDSARADLATRLNGALRAAH